MTEEELDALVKYLHDEGDDDAADAITALRAELAGERAKVEALSKSFTWQDFADVSASSSDEVGEMGDNLAIALCSYFDDHRMCPDDGEDGAELDDTGCWKFWVSDNAERVLRRIANQANATREAKP